VSSPLVTFLGLERKFSTGVGGPANLDVAFSCEDGSLFAIESKFCEPYSASKNKYWLDPAYFAGDLARWADVELQGAQQVAYSLCDASHDFNTLDVAQLLKHMLALGRCKQSATLCCLWYDDGGDCAGRHREELARFTELITDDAVAFTSLTYQDVLQRLEPLIRDEDARGYISYLRDRYLSS